MTTLLYNDPHPVHKAMADAISANCVAAEQGGPHKRFWSAITSRYNGNVILEGGVPLLEGAFLKVLRRVDGHVILLAADETISNLVWKLPYYSDTERRAHRESLKHVDGIIAVSDLVAEHARLLTDVPVVVSRPFVLDGHARELQRLRPGGEGLILAVGENRPAMNFELLENAANDRDLIIACKGTEELEHGVGYVSDEELIELYDKASLFCLPAQAGAYPVTTLEALMSGTPIMVSDRVGTHPLAEQLHEDLVVKQSKTLLKWRLNWFFQEASFELDEKARELSQPFDEQTGRQNFRDAYKQLVSRL